MSIVWDSSRSFSFDALVDGERRRLRSAETATDPHHGTKLMRTSDGRAFRPRAFGSLVAERAPEFDREEDAPVVSDAPRPASYASSGTFPVNVLDADGRVTERVDVCFVGKDEETGLNRSTDGERLFIASTSGNGVLPVE
jgi:hypothetical protein